VRGVCGGGEPTKGVGGEQATDDTYEDVIAHEAGVPNFLD
jgi:hypothetical protein